jgi:hypothetical protein
MIPRHFEIDASYDSYEYGILRKVSVHEITHTISYTRFSLGNRFSNLEHENKYLPFHVFE